MPVSETGLDSCSSRFDFRIMVPLHSAVLDTCRTGSASATAWAPYFLLAVLRRRGRRRCDGSFQVAGWPRILAARWAKDLPNPIRRSAVASLSAEFQLRLSLWPFPAYARWLRFAEQWLATFIQCPLPPSFCKARFSARQHPLPPHGLNARQLPRSCFLRAAPLPDSGAASAQLPPRGVACGAQFPAFRAVRSASYS
jgi:hypothetical protein